VQGYQFGGGCGGAANRVRGCSSLREVFLKGQPEVFLKGQPERPTWAWESRNPRTAHPLWRLTIVLALVLLIAARTSGAETCRRSSASARRRAATEAAQRWTFDAAKDNAATRRELLRFGFHISPFGTPEKKLKPVWSGATDVVIRVLPPEGSCDDCSEKHLAFHTFLRSQIRPQAPARLFLLGGE